MMHPSLVQKLRLLAMVLVVAATSGSDPAWARIPAHVRPHPAVHPMPAHAVPVDYRHHGLGGSLVRCTSLRQPHRSGAMASPRRVARFFAPTSQAVFFARAGDRCVWRAGTAARG